MRGNIKRPFSPFSRVLLYFRLLLSQGLVDATKSKHGINKARAIRVTEKGLSKQQAVFYFSPVSSGQAYCFMYYCAITADQVGTRHDLAFVSCRCWKIALGRF